MSEGGYVRIRHVWRKIQVYPCPASNGMKRNGNRPGKVTLMIRTRLLPILLLAFALAPVAPAAADHEANPRDGLEEVGFHDLGGGGFNTDIWTWVASNGGLYGASGTWGIPTTGGSDPGRECPSETDNPAAPGDSGVKIVDATDPANPLMVSRLPSVPGAQNNDPKILVGAPTTDGPRDILIQSLEPCGAEGLVAQIPGSPFSDFIHEIMGNVQASQAGFRIWDITDPANPVQRADWINGGIGTHNSYVFSRGGRSYVAAVWNQIDFVGLTSELIRGVLQVVEITDPSAPVLLGEWELLDAAPGDIYEDAGDICPDRGVDSGHCFLHDVWVDDANIAYLSYWDAGLILVDLTPTLAGTGSPLVKPTFVGQALDEVQKDGVPAEILDPEGWLNEEGNTHVAVPIEVGGRTIVMVGDEDFTGGGPIGIDVNAPGPLAGFQQTVQWAATPEVNGETADVVYVGTGCKQADYLLAGDVSGKIVLVDDATPPPAPFLPCPEPYLFGQKVNLAAANGAIGFIQFPDPATGPNANATAGSAPIPALELFAGPGQPVRDAVVADSEIVNPANSDPTVNVTMERGTPIDPWGFMRAVDVTDPDDANWREVNQFKAPHVEDQEIYSPDDTFSAHNPLIGPDGLVYFAWYTDGVQVLEADESSPGDFNEVARFVPRPDDHPDDNDTDPRGRFGANPGFWGSMAIDHPTNGQTLVFNAEINRGMYILSPDPFPLPSKCPGLEHLVGNHIVGTGAANVLTGTPGRDIICGRGGGDTIHGLAGNDVIDGGSGNDEIHGGSGNDRILASDGDDVVRAGPGNDRALGGLGDDLLVGGAGNDRLIGQDGDDTLRGRADADRLSGGPGNDRVAGARGTDRLRGGDGDDVLRGHKDDDRAAGGPGNDRVVGGSGDDRLRGQRGDDFLHGAGGDDRIGGGPGNDRIKGGKGRDRCNGGGGKDRVSGCGRRR